MANRNYVIAVSGGVDSVVLLDMLVRGALPNSNSQIPVAKIIVAHFDHGIRPDSAEDAEFVKSLADKYGLPFETKREELGKGASEELARERRYAFLRGVAKKHDAKIMTAHHLDDVVETIAINLTRGTGWRGLAVLNSPDIVRPLLDKQKTELLEYANEHSLQWHEDSTNKDTKYLRNEIRSRLHDIDEDTKKLLGLYRERQVFLNAAIEKEAHKITGKKLYERYMFINSPNDAATELLRAVLAREKGLSPTRPQLARALHAVKVSRGGKQYQVAEGVSLQFTSTHFVVVNR